MVKITFRNETHKVRGVPMEEAWHKVCPPEAEFQCPTFNKIKGARDTYSVVSAITHLQVGTVMTFDPRRV